MLDKKPVLLPGQIIEGIEGRIYSLRGQRVMLSHDLAALYQVVTKVLMQAVRRSIERFPEDFAFNPDNSLAPSFPRKRESSEQNTPRSGQNHNEVPLRGNFSINWIPASAGMTSFSSNELFLA